MNIVLIFSYFGTVLLRKVNSVCLGGNIQTLDPVIKESNRRLVFVLQAFDYEQV